MDADKPDVNESRPAALNAGDTLPETNPILEACAHAAHEAHRAYVRFHGGTAVQEPWDELPQSRKNLTHALVYNALQGQTPDVSHNAWYDEKIADGWEYGLSVNAEDKQSPWILPWEDLPAHYQGFSNVVHTAIWAMMETLQACANFENGQEEADNAQAIALAKGGTDGSA